MLTIRPQRLPPHDWHTALLLVSVEPPGQAGWPAGRSGDVPGSVSEQSKTTGAPFSSQKLSFPGGPPLPDVTCTVTCGSMKLSCTMGPPFPSAPILLGNNDSSEGYTIGDTFSECACFLALQLLLLLPHHHTITAPCSSWQLAASS